jgi:hypothetical protein
MYSRVFGSVISWYRTNFTKDVHVRMLSSGAMTLLLLVNIAVVITLSLVFLRNVIGREIVENAAANMVLYGILAVTLFLWNFWRYAKVVSMTRSGVNATPRLALLYSIASFIFVVGAVVLKLYLNPQ